jgi:uncharacterized protein YbbK (DUF523 family)
MTRQRPRIGVSACLLGEAVRYDGGHKRDRFLTDTLSPLVEWVPVCPEVELGLGTPREPIQIVRRGKDVRLRTVETGVDVTDRMRLYARRRVAGLAKEQLSGYVFKARSPSCGVDDVPVHLHRLNRQSRTAGRGLFAEAFIERYPNLPIVDENDLCRPNACIPFVERVFVYHGLQRLFAGRWSAADLGTFHETHAPLVGARRPGALRQLERILREGPASSGRNLARRYETAFLRAMATSR